MKKITDEAIKLFRNKALLMKSESDLERSDILWADGLLFFLESMKKGDISLESEIEYLNEIVRISASEHIKNMR